MDHRVNKRYKKLKVKRQQMPSKTNVSNSNLTSEIYDNDENFKIKRFMNDVKKFCEQPSVNELDHKARSDRFKIYKDTVKEKGNKNKESSNDFKSRKDKFKEVNHRRREGLFQRGVITKVFNKGLMPPTLNARLNEDLQKMIELANGKNYKHFQDDKLNKENMNSPISSCSNGQSYSQEPCGSICNKEIDSSNFNVGTKVQVDLDGKNNIGDNNNRNKCDLYLQFTHFVTRCLFNSGIDKLEMKSYSDSIKESLVKVYHNRITEDSLQENEANNSPNVSDMNVEHKTPNSYNSNEWFSINHCMSTSKSEEGPLRPRFNLATDSQLSDDVVIRKPVNKLYTSGLDYLKAVYNGSLIDNENISSNIDINSTFSPIQETVNDVSPCNETATLYNIRDYSTNTYDGSINGPQEHEHLSRCENVASNEFNPYACSITHDSLMPLQYFPGNNRPNRSYIDNCTHRNISIKSETVVNKEPLEKSPKYISLLPSHRIYHEFMNSYNVDPPSNSHLREHDYSRTAHPLLSLPVHVPQRKSPEIQYLPRKMF